MEYLYILKLKQGKWYVGRSANVERRFLQHLGGIGSRWTQLHEPIEIVMKRPLRNGFDEDDTTQIYMTKYGIDNVRGGKYCHVELPASIRRSLMTKQQHVAQVQWNNYSQLGEYDSGVCFRCGRGSHWQSDCYARTDVDGDLIED